MSLMEASPGAPATAQCRCNRCASVRRPGVQKAAGLAPACPCQVAPTAGAGGLS